VSDEAGETMYAMFWLYKALPEWRWLDEQAQARLREEFARALEASSTTIALRGAYSLVGLRHDADLLLWLIGPSLGAMQDLAVTLRKTGLGSYLDAVYTYSGLVPQSRYSPEHRPAFAKGMAPREYLSVYPFTKTHDWYQLPFEQRRSLMAQHGRMGQKHSALPEVVIEVEEPTAGAGGSLAVAEAVVAEAVKAAPGGKVMANTIHSFGLGDQEFVVAFESDDPAALEAMVEDLRGAEVRIYTANDTPIFLGRRKDVVAALSDLG